MVYVSTSSDESCNIPMMEANACGIPAVVFDCRGNYSDHCEYIKYGIVVNINKINKVSKEEQKRFLMAMRLIDHYHFCTRYLKINCFIPNIPETKFYDFPLSLTEFTDYCEKNKIKAREFTTEEWHKRAMKIITGPKWYLKNIQILND